MTASTSFASPIGPIKIVESEGFIVEVGILPPGTSALADSHASPLLEAAVLQLTQYFRGDRKSFSLPLRQPGTPFQQRVWEILRKIPYGETRSYQDIACALQNPRATRAIGQANGRNKIIILIPCHRVISKSGCIGGFSYGYETKRFLLSLEGNSGIHQ